jgi:hypothetical protein
MYKQKVNYTKYNQPRDSTQSGVLETGNPDLVQFNYVCVLFGRQTDRLCGKKTEPGKIIDLIFCCCVSNLIETVYKYLLQYFSTSTLVVLSMRSTVKFHVISIDSKNKYILYTVHIRCLIDGINQWRL